MCEREQRGIVIAAQFKITQKGQVWLVPSQSGSGSKYTVCPDEQQPHCSCPDHETRGGVCKHIFAVRTVMKREQSADGTETITKSVTVTETIKRKSYGQKWPEYNKAQVNEKRHFQELLADLCKPIETPEQTGKGRPVLPMNDAIFAAAYKVYSTVSARRFMTDLTESHANGFIGKLPCYNSILKYLDSEEITPILLDMIQRSSLPLRAFETTFAVDSSGFTGSRFAKWFDCKYNREHQEHVWIKAHIAIGVNTQIVTAVKITDQFSHDTGHLPELMDTTAENFEVREVCADKGYESVANINKIVSMGADPYVAFRKSTTGWSGGMFGKAFHFFAMYREEFLESYHQRSNVESAFSMIKRKFGDNLRSKTDVAMKNELLCKVVCHNICCLISAMYELGVEPKLLAV